MPAHRNITTALPSGITMPSGTVMEDVGYESSIEVAELPSASTGEITLVGCVNHEHRVLTISGDGPLDFASVAAGNVSTMSNYAILDIDISEATKQRCRFTLKASADLSFTDPGGTASDDGAEPVITDLTIVSVEYAVVETVRRAKGVGEHLLLGTDSAPAYKAKEGVTFTAEIAGRGDTPSGFALGTGGASFAGAATGIVIMTRKTNGERRKDWNRYGGSISQYLSAA